MRFPDLQHCNHLGICQKCKFSGQQSVLYKPLWVVLV